MRSIGQPNSKKSLVYCEHKVGNLRGANRGRSEDVTKAKVFHVADKFAGSMREGEGVTPEEPLEGDQSGGCQGQPDEGEGRLAAGKTRVEESGMVSRCMWTVGDVISYPTPGIMSNTKAVEVIIHAISL
jgi:hypothetical protein